MLYSLYKDENKTDVLIVESANFPMNITSGTIHTIVIGDTTYTYAPVVSYNVSYAEITDESTLVKFSPTVEPVSRTFYLVPNNRIEIKCMKKTNNFWGVTARLYVGENSLGGSLINHDFGPADYFSIHVGEFTIKDQKFTGVYVRRGDNQLFIAAASANFWDGSANPKTVSTSPAKKSTSRGGQGTYNWNSDPWKPAKQWASANTLNTHAHGLHAYIINNQMLDYLHETLWSGNIIDKWRNYKFNPIGGIIALHCLPRPVPTNGAANQVTICGQGFYMGGLAPDLTQSCQFIEWTSESIQLDSSEYSESYLDYAPYMNAILKLPFVGWQAVDINTIMDGSFYLHYTIDIINGNCIVELWVTDRDGHEFCYGGWSGNCAYSMPITANDGGGMAPIKSAVAASISLAVPALSAAAVLGGMASSLNEKDTDYSTSSMGEGSPKQGLMSAIDAFSAKHNMSIAGQMPANIATMTDDLDIHLILTGQNNVTSISGNVDADAIVGSPASWVGKMSDFTDELIQGIVHAHDIPHATDEEKNEIESLIKGGVYL